MYTQGSNFGVGLRVLRKILLIPAGFALMRQEIPANIYSVSLLFE